MRFKLKVIKYLIEIKFNKYLYKNNLHYLRERRFKALLKHCIKSEYYKKNLRKGNKLQDFPLMNKALFMHNFNSINTCNIKLDEAFEVAKKSEETRDFSPTISNITIGLSSGTSGNRGVFLASENERANWVAAVLDRVIGFSLKKRSVAFFLRANSNIYDSVKSKVLSFNFFDLLKPVSEHIERLKVLQPTILVGQPSILVQLAKAVEEGKLSLKPAKIISVAEVLSPEDKNYLSAVFEQIIHQVYQCTEGFLASSCKNGTLHLNEDFIIIEKKYLDSDKRRFHPIITDLKRRSQPIIRYELNDILIAKDNCPCGSKMQAIESIEGRSDDILLFTNSLNEQVKIFPDFFRRAIILADNSIMDYALIQHQLDHLSLYIKSNKTESFNLAEKAIKKLLYKNGVLNVKITSIKDNKHIKGTKLRRVKNDIGEIN